MSYYAAAERSEQGTEVRSRRRPLLGAVAVVCAVTAACFGLGFIQGPYLSVRRIQVQSPTAAVSRVVQGNLHLGPGASTLFTPVDGLVGSALSCPWVQEVEVTRRLPDTLIVSCTERTPVATVELTVGCLLVDGEGVIMSVLPQPARGLPLLCGLTDCPDQPGQRLGEAERALLRECASLASLPPAARALRIDVTNPNEVTCLTPDGVWGKLGGVDNLERKLLMFNVIHRQLIGRGEKPRYIDVRLMQRPVWMSR